MEVHCGGWLTCLPAQWMFIDEYIHDKLVQKCLITYTWFLSLRPVSWMYRYVTSLSLHSLSFKVVLIYIFNLEAFSMIWRVINKQRAFEDLFKWCFMSVYCVCVCACECRYSQGPEEGSRTPRAGVNKCLWSVWQGYEELNFDPLWKLYSLHFWASFPILKVVILNYILIDYIEALSMKWGISDQ